MKCVELDDAHRDARGALQQAAAKVDTLQATRGTPEDQVRWGKGMGEVLGASRWLESGTRGSFETWVPWQ